MTQNSADRTAIVTGGASGIGLGISLRLARDGAKVGIFDLDPDAAEAAAATIRAEGGTALAVPVDVADRAQIDQGVARVRAAFGAVGILVNNAGREGSRPSSTSPRRLGRTCSASTSPARSTAARPCFPT